MTFADLWMALDRAGFETMRALFSVLWQSTILLAAAGLLALALRRRSPSVRQTIWAAAVVLAPVLPILAYLATTVLAAIVSVAVALAVPLGDKLSTAESQKAAVPAAPDSDHAAWCPLVRGLQAGTTFGQPHYPYRPGETVTYNIYLSNCKGQPVTLVFQEPAAWVPIVYKERGGPVDRDVGGLKDDAAPAERKVTLAPSEKVLVGTVQLKLDATPKDNPGGPHIYLEPGQYRVNWTGRVKESGQANGFEISARSPLLMVAGPEEAAGAALPAAPPDAMKPSSVGIYLVADPQYAGGAEKVPLTDLKLEAKPLLADKDIVAYYWNDHIIQLTPDAFQALQRMRELWLSPGCRAFVVVADGQRCYLGAFQSMPASLVPKVPLGYIWTSRQRVLPENAIRIGPSPWDPKRPQDQDTRNDPRLRQALAALGKFPKTVAAEAPWGEAVEGVQVRLRADKVQWKAGETPTLHVECRNSGKELWWVPKTEPLLGILVDGKSYYKTEYSQRQFSDRLEPGKTVALANVVLSGWQLTDGENGPLDLQPGKHRVQVFCRPGQIGTDTSGGGRLDEFGGSRGIKISSNPVEIEILPVEAKAAAPPAGPPAGAPAVNLQAVKDFGVARTGPIETGYFFYAGKYIDAPYFVERRGLDTYINDCLVRRGPAWPRPVPDPGDPPPGAKAEDPYWNAKWRWLSGHNDFPKAVDLMAEAYGKSGTFSVVNVKADGRAADILLVPSNRQEASTTKTFVSTSPLQDAEHDKDYLVRGLGPDAVEMVRTGGASEILMNGDTGLKFLRIIASDKSPEEKQKDLEAGGLCKGPEMARQLAAITASAQLAKRLAEGPQTPERPPVRRVPRPKNVVATVPFRREKPQSLLALPADGTPVQKQVNELLLRLSYARFNDPPTETKLFALGEPAARELFRLAVLPSDNYDLRSNIRKLIARFPGDKAREIVEAELPTVREPPSPDINERHRRSERFGAAMEILRTRLDRASVPALLKALDAVNFYDERSNLIMVLGEIGDPSAAPAIRPYLDDSDEMMRSHATQALIKLNAMEITPELRQRYGPGKPLPPAPPPKPLAPPFAADAMTAVTITIGHPSRFVLTVPPDRLPEVFQAIDGAASTPLPTERFFGEGWRWPTTDPLITVTLKDGSKVEIMMAVAGKPPFLLRDAQKTFFDSPKLVGLVNEAIHAGLVADLADPDFVKQFKAAAALFDRGDSAGHGVLVEALKADKPVTVRAGAAIRLLKEHTQEALKTADDLAAADLSGSDGQALVRAIAYNFPAQAVPILRKFWLDGQFPLHDRTAIQGLGGIASPEAIETLIDVWGSGSEFKMQLVYAAGRCFEPEAKAEAVAWWQKNKGRPRMELLADGYVTDTGGHGYGQYPLEEMQKLDRAGAVRELMRRLPAAGGDELERITKGLQKLTGVCLGTDKNLWLQWWRSNPEAKSAAPPGPNPASKPPETKPAATVPEKTTPMARPSPASGEVKPAAELSANSVYWSCEIAFAVR